MLFTSYAFLGFVGLLLVVYYVVPGKFQWSLLLVCSYFFYFMADPRYLIYIFVTSTTVYLTAIFIAKKREKQNAYLKEHKEEMSKEERKAYKDKQKKNRCFWLMICLLLNLGILVVVKYSNFFISNINGILSVFGKDRQLDFVTLIMPLGISFYTFQAISYLIDVYHEAVDVEKIHLS